MRYLPNIYTGIKLISIKYDVLSVQQTKTRHLFVRHQGIKWLHKKQA